MDTPCLDMMIRDQEWETNETCSNPNVLRPHKPQPSGSHNSRRAPASARARGRTFPRIGFSALVLLLSEKLQSFWVPSCFSSNLQPRHWKRLPNYSQMAPLCPFHILSSTFQMAHLSLSILLFEIEVQKTEPKQIPTQFTVLGISGFEEM